MPKQDKNWKRRKIKSGNTDFGWITFSDLTKNEFERKRDKLFAGTTRFPASSRGLANKTTRLHTDRTPPPLHRSAGVIIGCRTNPIPTERTP